VFLACGYRGRDERTDCGVGIPSLERDDSGGAARTRAGRARRPRRRRDLACRPTRAGRLGALPRAGLPSGATGWVLRRALAGYGAVRTHLVVDLGAFRATLLGGRPAFSAAIGVGRPEWPTPTGRFYVRNRLTRYASPFYGPVAFGTSALTDWPAGGFVGIHGTNRPELLPGQVSHGCIRLRNEDIRELARLMPIGTPITIR
jgi:L,D-transpeptidase catalytic domain